MIANTPQPPYYAVIFTSIRAPGNEGYNAMLVTMLEIAGKQAGFLGIESARNDLGITVSYWDSMESIRAWKVHIDHLEAQKLGRTKWYEKYKVRIAKVERDYAFEKQSERNPE